VFSSTKTKVFEGSLFDKYWSKAVNPSSPKKMVDAVVFTLQK
jgi:hypothetical protein